MVAQITIDARTLSEDTAYTVKAMCSYRDREPGETSSSLQTNDRPNCTACRVSPASGENKKILNKMEFLSLVYPAVFSLRFCSTWLDLLLLYREKGNPNV